VDIDSWLGELGLAQYAQAFADNDIDAETLVELTNEDLKELGVTSLGHRKKILAAILQAIMVKGPPQFGQAVMSILRERSVGAGLSWGRGRRGSG
jgi:hypothetical protein